MIAGTILTRKRQMKKPAITTGTCAVAKSLDILGGWWTLLIVRDALGGLTRFGEFQRSLGAAKNILAQRLKELVAEGIFETRPVVEGGAYLEYHLTEKGLALVPILVSLSQWSSEFAATDGEALYLPVDAKNLQPLATIGLRSSTGKLLTNADVKFASGLEAIELAKAHSSR